MEEIRALVGRQFIANEKLHEGYRVFLSSMQLSHTLPTLKPRLTYLFFLTESEEEEPMYVIERDVGDD